MRQVGKNIRNCLNMCLFIHHTIWIYLFLIWKSLFVLYSQNCMARISAGYAGTTTNVSCFRNMPKNPYLNQVTQKNTCQVFLPKKNPGIENFKPKKILRSFPHSRVPPLGERLSTGAGTAALFPLLPILPQQWWTSLLNTESPCCNNIVFLQTLNPERFKPRCQPVSRRACKHLWNIDTGNHQTWKTVDSSPYKMELGSSWLLSIL